MPRVRRIAKLRRPTWARETLTIPDLLHLMIGPGSASRFRTAEDAREAWLQSRDEFMRPCAARRGARCPICPICQKPGKRWWAWWRFEAKQQPRGGEPQYLALARMGELTAAEIALMKPEEIAVLAGESGGGKTKWKPTVTNCLVN